MKYLRLAAITVLAGCADNAPIAQKSMDSFHIGGREVTISDIPVMAVQFTPSRG